MSLGYQLLHALNEDIIDSKMEDSKRISFKERARFLGNVEFESPEIIFTSIIYYVLLPFPASIQIEQRERV